LRCHLLLVVPHRPRSLAVLPPHPVALTAPGSHGLPPLLFWTGRCCDLLLLQVLHRQSCHETSCPTCPPRRRGRGGWWQARQAAQQAHPNRGCVKGPQSVLCVWSVEVAMPAHSGCYLLLVLGPGSATRTAYCGCCLLLLRAPAGEGQQQAAAPLAAPLLLFEGVLERDPRLQSTTGPQQQALRQWV
jgi:hypothetical protein